MEYSTVLFILVSFWVHTPSEQIELPCVEDKIHNGKDVSIEDVPYMAGVGVAKFVTCGASIISETFVLTAGHCVLTDPPNIPYWVLVGSYRVYNPRNYFIPVKKINIHQKFNSFSNDYDVAVLELKEKIKFTKRIKPVPLTDKTPFIGEKVQITGWGKLYPTDERYQICLKGINMTVLDWKSCGESPSTMICAGEEGTKVLDGDSGGPLTLNGSQVGIAIWSEFESEMNVTKNANRFTSITHPEIREFIKKYAKV